MTTGTPAPAGLALASYERPVGVNPPLNYPAYRSTALRAPRQPLQVMPQGLTEVTGPLLGRERVIAADADLTTQHEGEPIRADPVLRAVAGPGRRGTLIAAAQPGPPGGPGGYRFDIHLQGDQETVFFDV